MHRLLLIPFLGLLSISSSTTLSADKEAPAPIAVDVLIQQLGDRSYKIRVAAGKALEDRGADALPALRAASNSDDEEVRRRVEVLVQQIERSALLMPKRITLKMKDANIEDIVKELAKQSGYKLQFQGGQQRRMTIEMENVTYWQAMEKLCNEAGLSPGFEEQQGIVYLYQQNTVSPYTHHTGPFRFVAQNFNYSRYVNLANIPRTGTDANQQDNNSLSFGFMIQSEPKSPLLAVGPPRLTKAEDENGVSLLPRTNDQQQFNVQYNEGNGLYRNFQHSVGVQLAKPVKDAARVKIIQGKVLVTLLSGTKADVVIDNLAVGKKKLVGTGANAEITIEDISEQNKVWTLTLLIKRIAKQGEHDYNWMNSLQQKMELQDAKGRKYQSNGVSNYINTSETSVHAAYQFSMPPNAELGPAVKLVLSRWLTISQEVEFEFKDLPLP